jgi:CRP-like cAMP-binding protein
MIAIMSPSLIDTLSKLATRDQTLSAGEILFRSGDPILSLFLVASGALRLTRPLPHGLQLTLQRAGSGAILAEASLYADCYHCDALAAESSVVRVVPLQSIKTALLEDRNLARGWTTHLAHEVQHARAQVEMLSLKTVAERIDAWLALNDCPLPPKGRWRQLASEVGVAPEALYRELAKRR